MELFTDLPLQTVIESYLYNEYADDDDCQAFVNSYNDLSQQYLDWFNNTPMGVYTDPSISGSLLDYIANNLYGIFRPVISTLSQTITGELGTNILGTHTLGTLVITKSGTALVATDDIYKRTLTWYLYRGDGLQMSIEWLRRRIARFIYGVGGADIDIGLIVNVGITITSASAGSIVVPNTVMGQTFQTMFNSGLFPMPFQISFSVGLA